MFPFLHTSLRRGTVLRTGTNIPVCILRTIRPALQSHDNIFVFVFLRFIPRFSIFISISLFHCIFHIHQIQGQAIYSLKQTGTGIMRRRDSACRWRRGVGLSVYPPISSTTYISKQSFFLQDYRIFKEKYCKSKLDKRGHLLSLICRRHKQSRTCFVDCNVPSGDIMRYVHNARTASIWMLKLSCPSDHKLNHEKRCVDFDDIKRQRYITGDHPQFEHSVFDANFVRKH